MVQITNSMSPESMVMQGTLSASHEKFPVSDKIKVS